jgi:Zn-dependent protease
MRLSWKMGQVAGIDLYIHATFLLAFLVLPELAARGVPPLEAILLVCAVFGCVLLHELGHALMARRFGIGTVDITLYPIGGVARLQRLPRAPGAEFLIALAGPAVNFAIAAILFLLTSLAGVLVGLSWFDLLARALLKINLGLALFNLIPAFPMDGGRVLRAVLSTALGRAQATRIASTIGQTLAVLFGMVALVSTGNPIHLALAAVIFFAARSEEAHVLHEERRRSVAQNSSQGMWVAPPGYRWVHRGNGFWQLARMGMYYPNHATRDTATWR